MISLLVALVVVGALLYLLKMVPMDGRIRTVIYVVVSLCLFFWVLQLFGFLPAGYLPHVR